MSWLRRSMIKVGEVISSKLGLPAINKSGGTIAAGTLVYISSYDSSGYPVMSKADADVANALATWVTSEAVLNGNVSVLLKHYVLQGQNTNAGNVGDPVYTDKTTAGGYVLADPGAAGADSQVVGRIKTKSATVGEVEFDILAHDKHWKFSNLRLVAGLLSADATGRALMANNFFDAATALAKFAANSLDATFSASAFAANAIPVTKLAANALQYADVSLTNAEVLALRAAPKTLVAAPGAGKVLELVSAILTFDYTAAYTAGAGDDLAIRYQSGAGAIASDGIEATAFLTAAADAITSARPKIDLLASGAIANQPLVLHNIGGAEFGGGNAANVVRVRVAYRVHDTNL